MVWDEDSEVQHITLIDSLDGEWLKLPLEVMRSCGPAVQTLGGLLKITNKDTFVKVAEIARRARVPRRTAQKHLKTLAADEWIVNRGRRKTRAGRPRRTATIQVTKKTRDSMEPWGFLPWWACCRVRRFGRLQWSARAVLSVIMAKLCSLKSVATDQGLELDYWHLVCHPAERFSYSLSRLEGETGLHRESIVSAKRELERAGIIECGCNGDGLTTDTLDPNWDFAAVITPGKNGGCYVDFRR